MCRISPGIGTIETPDETSQRSAGPGFGRAVFVSDRINPWSKPMTMRNAGRPREDTRPTLFALHVPGVAQAVAEKIQRQQRRDQHTAGKGNQPPVNPNG